MALEWKRTAQQFDNSFYDSGVVVSCVFTMESDHTYSDTIYYLLREGRAFLLFLFSFRARNFLI
jgi:hypothetical protein